MDKSTSPFGNGLSLTTVFIVLDFIAAFLLLLVAGIMMFVFPLGAAFSSLQAAIIWLLVVFPFFLFVVGAKVALRLESISKKKALLWAASPWPLTAISVLLGNWLVE